MKIFCLTEILIYGKKQPARAATRDASRSSRNVARVAMEACGVSRVLPVRRNAAAYGEIVWSWRRDRGVYSRRPIWRDNGDNQRRSPGRARISRKPLRGEGRDVSAVPVKPVCVLSPPHCTRL